MAKLVARSEEQGWITLELACFALFIGDRELARKTAEAARASIWLMNPRNNAGA